jgi:hypothetical protein
LGTFAVVKGFKVPTSYISVRHGIILFATTLSPSKAKTVSTYWVPGTLSPEVKCPDHEPYHRYHFSVEVKNAWTFAFNPPTHLISMTSIDVLVKI